MYKKKKILAIIPARSGSKRLKDKNIKILNGYPLLNYTINEAKECKFFDTILVSTDSKKYADIAKKLGADVPFLRSKKNSLDKTPTIKVIVEVLEMLKKKKYFYDIVIVLQPTSPMRRKSDIKKALNLFFKKQANAVVSVNLLNHPLAWCNTIPNNLSMHNFINKKYLNKTAQEINKFYTLNGAIFIAKTSLIKSKINIYKKGTFAYVMDSKNSIDIDTEEDFEYAEYLMRNQ